MGENIEKSCHAEEQEIKAEEAVLEWYNFFIRIEFYLHWKHSEILINVDLNLEIK